MPRPLLLALLAAAATPSGAAAPVPRRIVSLNLCADQYLLALADPKQIAGLTRYAGDVELSAAAAQAKRYRLLHDSAEELLAIGPDLILGSPGFGGGPLAALPANSYRVVDLPPAASYRDIRVQIGVVAAAIGHPARGTALTAAMDHALAALPRPHRGGVAAYYQRRGYLTGAGTLVDDLMTRAGLTNLATRLGKPALSRLSLEELIAARPDYLIVEEDSLRVADQGTEMLNHPALRHIPRIVLPQAWTVCGGPAYVSAARSLSAQLTRRRR